MKHYIYLFFFLLGFVSVAQTEQNPKLEVRGDMIFATYFYDNGTIHQQGFFSKDGALDGLWTSYDIQGNKMSHGYYSNGIKTGQWLFWTDDALKVVDYVDSKIINVSERRQKPHLALNIK